MCVCVFIDKVISINREAIIAVFITDNTTRRKLLTARFEIFPPNNENRILLLKIRHQQTTQTRFRLQRVNLTRHT